VCDGFVSYKHLTVLHPRLKLAYFKQQDWPDEWITTARSIVRAEYDRKYAGLVADEEMDDEPDDSVDISEVCFAVFIICRLLIRSTST
jgi:hypothetical protein